MPETSYIYVIADRPDGPVKIGLSRDPDRRVRQLQTGHAEPLTLHHKEEIPADAVRAYERIIHRTVGHLRMTGEWFRLTVEEAVAEIQHAVIRYGSVENLSGRLAARLL